MHRQPDDITTQQRLVLAASSRVLYSRITANIMNSKIPHALPGSVVRTGRVRCYISFVCTVLRYALEERSLELTVDDHHFLELAVCNQ
jgi:hypothetical protein